MRYSKLFPEKKITFAVVDTDDGANHFWDDNNVAEMSLDAGWFLTDLAGHSFLGLNHIINKRPTY